MSDAQLNIDREQYGTMEKYTLNGSDKVIRFSSGTNVVLTLEAESEQRHRDSARAQHRVLSDYKWDIKPFVGRLLAVQGNLIAYRISHDPTGEVVRVMETGNMKRQLIKGFREPIVDLQWSRHTNLLAVLDTASNLYVYYVNEQCSVSKYVNIIWNDPKDVAAKDGADKENLQSVSSARPHLSWCPYTPEEGDPNDQCNMIAITKGKTIHIINLTTLKSAKKDAELDLATAKDVEGAVLNVSLNDDISTVCISPDATAAAIVDVTGLVSFYIIDSMELRFAHHWSPPMSLPPKELHFLDNCTAMEQFWRFCVAGADDGHLLGLFECENWACVAKLQIDSALHLNKFDVICDSHARYVYLVDKDGANMFCLEVDVSSGQPLFASVTQITFSHPIVAIAPYDLKDIEINDSEFCFDEEEAVRRAEVVVSLIAITPRNVSHLSITLEKTEGRGEQRTGEATPVRNDHASVELLSGLGASSVRSHGDTPSAQYMHPSMSQAHVTPSNLLDIDVFNRKIDELNDKIEQLTLRAERADNERRAAATNESILSLLQQFKEEFSLREDRLMANISELIEANRVDTINEVRNALNENSLAVENSIQANHKIVSEVMMSRVAEKTREAITAVVIPSVDRVVTQLFKQLNEQFKEGLNQYLAQMRLLHTATLANTVASTPAPLCQDRQSLLQMIKSRNPQMAFESVLNQADEASLEFVYKQVDPDELFQNGPGLSQQVLLSLLQQLSYGLEKDTELKFRYIEHILSALRPYDAGIAVHVPKVLAMIVEALEDFQNRTTNKELRRQALLMLQLSRYMSK